MIKWCIYIYEITTKCPVSNELEEEKREERKAINIVMIVVMILWR